MAEAQDPAPKRVLKSRKKKFLTTKDIEARKNADIEVIKARTSERERYNANRLKLKEASIIEKARLKRLNPTAFASENAPVFDMTGQKAPETPEELDKKQRKESIRALGKLSYSAEPHNFVVEKPLAPNAMDLYQAQKMKQRETVRNQRAFAPVQKL
jgi:hypothetical protein